MKIISGEELYTTGDISQIIGKSTQTINLWYKYSKILEKQHKKRLIPSCIRINNIKYWDSKGVEKIIEFSNSIQRGDLALLNRANNTWGKRSVEIQKRIDLKKQRKAEELKKFKELSIREQEKILWEKKFKYLKKKAKKDSNKN